MANPIGTMVRTTATLIVVLVTADILGVLFCTMLDITPLRFKSALLPYAIWLVLGSFSGLFSYVIASGWSSPEPDEQADWLSDPAMKRTGGIVVATSAAIIAALIYGFNSIFWSKGVAGEYYVPDSAPHSLVFFLSALAVIAGVYFVMLPTEPGRE